MVEIKFQLPEDFKNAEKAYAAGDYHDALTILHELILLNYSLVDCYRLQAACYIRLGQLDNIKSSLQEIINLNAATIGDLYSYAQACTYLNKLPDAEKAYAECVRMEPMNIEHQLKLIDIFMLENKRNNASAYIESILNNFPDQADALYRKALLNQDEKM
ncbi:MAG: hypothetical protein ACK4PR_10910, partial [Gammaproteobacteria bacterium]